MNVWFREAFLVAVACAAFGVAVVASHAVLTAPRTYAECMLDVMKGRGEHMIRLASVVCRERFPL